MNATLPQWAVDILANPPRSGEGFHLWLFRAARALWKCGRDENDIREILQNAAATCGRCVSLREIEDAVRNSRKGAFQPASAQRHAWPSVNAEQREAIIANGFGLVDLWEISPQEGKESEHTLSSTGPRRFLVIEQDRGTVDEQAAILQHLAERAPLSLVVHSGSKSLHGWFYCSGQTEDRLQRFMRYVVSLGADPATWTRLQFCRMPDGTRENGKRQTVYFLNQETVK